MTLTFTPRRLLNGALTMGAIALVAVLYLTNLSSMGLLSTDEPRYADIGRGMAQSGDWITPRLWGQAWFEKPPLLYWMVAAGFKLGLGPETAPRLPVALMALLFLAFFWFRLRHLWDARTATCSTLLLASGAGWQAYSRVAVTDIPAAVLFSMAVLLAPKKDQTMGQTDTRFTVIAALLGLATLAKSLFPLVLFLPVLALDYRRLRMWFRPGPLLAFAAVSLPWHVLCAARNGPEFLRILFVQHQFGRFTSPDLQHSQPWWFYLPVLLLLLYPWSPLLVLAAGRQRDRSDPRLRPLLGVVAFGFLFISVTVNKLPGYLLPLLPSLCVLIGVGLARHRNPARLLIAPVALLGVLPVAARVVPAALATGLHTAAIPWPLLPFWLGAALLAGSLFPVVFKRFSFCAAAGCAAFSFLWFQFAVFPQIDSIVSARPLWIALHPSCVPELHRRLRYGLNYYAGRELPRCDILIHAAPPVAREPARPVKTK